MIRRTILNIKLIILLSIIFTSYTFGNQDSLLATYQRDIRRVAHSERIDINVSNISNRGAIDPTSGINPTSGSDIEILGVFLDGKPYDDYQLSEDGIILSLPADTRLEHSHLRIDTNHGRIVQTLAFVASFGSSNLIALVEGQSESQFRRYVTSLGMELSSFYTVLGGDLSLANVQLNEQSSAQGLEQLHAMQQLASQTAAAPPLWVSSPQMLYKPLRRIHSLDPSCTLWPELQDVTRQWRPLFLEADRGQADVLEALSVPRAHARGDSGQGVNVFVLDSASESNDLFTCANASIEGHGRHLQTIIQAIAPAANTVPFPVCDESGACLTQDIAKALLSLQSVLTTGSPTIVTLALGSPPHPEFGIDAVVYHSLERLSRRYDNLLVVASAGNNGLDGNYQSITPRLPAGFWQGNWQDAQGTPLEPLNNVISVGGIGLQASRNLIDYDVTPFNPQVPISMLAPAARVCLPHPDGGCAPDGGEQGLTGSSFAAPFVSGAAALFWEACPNLSASDLRAWLLRDSNFDILIDGEQPSIPVVNAFHTEGCPEVSVDTLPAEPATLEPLSLASNQRYPLGQRITAVAEHILTNASDQTSAPSEHTINQLSQQISTHGEWRSSDANIASIDASNRVHAHAAGEVTLSLHLLTPDPQQQGHLAYSETSHSETRHSETRHSETRHSETRHGDTDRVIAQVTLTVQPYACNDPPTIADAALAQRMAERWGNPLTCDVMAQAERLYAMNLGLTNLAGFEYAPNVREINLGHNPLGDGGEDVLEPLSHLQHLETLYLFGSGLNERHLPPLNALTNLKLLSLHENAISNIDAWEDAAFTNLETLWLYQNNLSDITPLRRFGQLHSLNLGGNHIQDLAPLHTLTKLVTLNLAANDIDDIRPLAGLSALETLILFDNAVTNLQSLANLRTLHTLDVKGNDIRDIRPLAGLANLSQLELAHNPLDTIEPLRNLTLDLLDVSGSAVSDLSPIAHMTRLTTLRAAYNGVRDITPLANMRFLTELDLGANIGLGSSPETLEVLATLINLRHLDVSLTGLPANGLAPLADLAALQTLQASSNRIRDLTPLRNLPRLSHVDVRSNHIVDLRPLVDNAALTGETTIRLTGNDLLFNPQDALADIEALHARGIHLDIEDMQNGLPATHLVRFVQGEQVMNSHAPDNRDGSRVVLEHPHPSPLASTLINTDTASEWFEMFAPGNYRTRHYANQGWMVRLRGTTLCLSANHPFNGMNVTLWRCLPDDPWQQWQLQHVPVDTSAIDPNANQAFPTTFPTEASLATNNPDARRASEQGHWQLVMPNPQGEAYCVSSESDSVDSTNTDTANTNSTDSNSIDSSNVIMWRCAETDDGALWQFEPVLPAGLLEHVEHQ